MHSLLIHDITLALNQYQDQNQSWLGYHRFSFLVFTLSSLFHYRANVFSNLCGFVHIGNPFKFWTDFSKLNSIDKNLKAKFTIVRWIIFPTLSLSDFCSPARFCQVRNLKSIKVCKFYFSIIFKTRQTIPTRNCKFLFRRWKVISSLVGN